jgi:hypothetical protein
MFPVKWPTYAGSTVGVTPSLLNWKRGGGGDGRCDAEEPTGRYAAYTERTITVEKGLAIALGDEAAYRRLRMRVVISCPAVRRDGTGLPLAGFTREPTSSRPACLASLARPRVSWVILPLLGEGCSFTNRPIT